MIHDSRFMIQKNSYKALTFLIGTLFFIGAISLIINAMPIDVGVLGVRQIFRFILLFFVVLLLVEKEKGVGPYFSSEKSEKGTTPFSSFQKKFFGILFGIVLIQSVLGISQAVSGGRFDEFLLPNERKVIGSIQLTTGTKQFWQEGQRVFGTMGRYDQLGSFLAIMLLMIVAFLYEKEKGVRPCFSEEKQGLTPFSFTNFKLLVTSYWLPVTASVGILTLVLTYSRASWIAFLLGLFVIGVVIKRDKKVIAGFLVACIALGMVYFSSGKVVGYLIDSPRQTISERVFEAMSPSRWMGEYYGLGRLFFMVNTPRALITYAPLGGLIGVGPGTFGGGVAQALHYTKSYGILGLPFGIWGSEGHIDNNWFSLLGEIGFLGVVVYLDILGILFFYSYQLYKGSKTNSGSPDGHRGMTQGDAGMTEGSTGMTIFGQSEESFTRALGLGYCGVLTAFFVLGFFAMYFEMRTLAPYVWIMGGMILVQNLKLKSQSYNTKLKNFKKY